MEPIIYMALGASGLAGVILIRLAAKHGLAWMRAQLKARASGAEADFKAKVAAAAGDLVPRVAALEREVEAAIDGDLARVNAELAALKAKSSSAAPAG